ncbi:hypothetical protein CTAYLR_006197 [Chrysophaeum taylorii]|uniref:NADPH--hemoprotein reductase n=1 Tax=Chrysophaeum taylorii TaxID=2483200 RepID=A0AAD7XQ04_9STRA|nr:hypothetical protein CTAYLR_006197 [Chrysophaeum taylorii]
MEGASLVVVAVAVLVACGVWFALRRSPAGVNEKKSPPPAPSKEEGPALTVCFGSQTGTAEQFAKELCIDAKREGYNARILDLEDFEDVSDLRGGGGALVFAMATYGEGEPTDNAHGFMKWAKKAVAEGETPLAGQAFAVFGLGNTQYEHYNAVGKQTDALLAQLGGERFAALGLGDDDGDLEGDFARWRGTLWRRTKKEEDSGGETKVETSFEVAVEGDSEEFSEAAALAAGRGAESAPSSCRFYFTAHRLCVVESRELRAPLDGGSTRHVEVSVPRKHVEETTSSFYEAADTLHVLPENAEDLVLPLARALGFQGNERFAVIGATPFPSPCTVKTALERYCDLAGKPKERQLRALASVAEDSPRMRELSEDLKRGNWTPPPDSSLASTIIALADGAPLATRETRARALAVFLDAVAPRLQPRAYTISSSPRSDPDRVHVTCALVHTFEDNPGVCSGYLGSLRAGDSCRAFVRPSAFRPPPRGPLVLVGPGTGLAPMRAILRDVSVGGTWRPTRCILYFGCKRPDLDHLYRDEMETWVADGVLNKLEIAYSRAQSHKVYVQHLMQRPDDATSLCDALLGEKGALLVCGATQMGADVASAIRSIFASRLGSAEAADEAIRAMRAEGRYVQELWA